MEGDNLIGRRSKGTEVDIPIETSDPSMDRRHCIINVKRNKQGETFIPCVIMTALQEHF